MLAILPCSPWVVFDSEPSGLRAFTSKDAPLQAGEVDEGGIARPVRHRRVPAEPVPLVRSFPETHAAGGDDRERERTVVDQDQVDAVPPTPAQPPLGGRPAVGGLRSRGPGTVFEALDPQVTGQVRQHEGVHDRDPLPAPDCLEEAGSGDASPAESTGRRPNPNSLVWHAFRSSSLIKGTG